jgi:predicted nucleic acid-binding protein
VTDQAGEQRAGDIAVVDTMIASAILIGAGHPKSADLLERYSPHLRGVSVVLSFATVCEIRYGALKRNFGQRRVDAMEEWFRKVTVVLPDNDLVHACARLRAECWSQGHGLADKVHDSDRWIASTAIRYDIPLISDDRVFVGVPALNLIQVNENISHD